VEELQRQKAGHLADILVKTEDLTSAAAAAWSRAIYTRWTWKRRVITSVGG
jgi:hypothetical protein